MCSCENIEIGSGQTEVELQPWWRGRKVCVDKCLKEEIITLWRNGIRTTGCCCGHNKLKPMINVVERHHGKMIELGYTYWTNEFGAICYEPKSI